MLETGWTGHWKVSVTFGETPGAAIGAGVCNVHERSGVRRSGRSFGGGSGGRSGGGHGPRVRGGVGRHDGCIAVDVGIVDVTVLLTVVTIVADKQCDVGIARSHEGHSIDFG